MFYRQEVNLLLKSMKNLYYYTLVCLLVFSCIEDDTVTEVEDEQETEVEVPIAVDDIYAALENTDFLIQGMLDNDTIFEFARVDAFDEQTIEGGSIESRGNNNFLYSPPHDFIGTDAFTYTICDNLSPINCSTATVYINVQEEINNSSLVIILADDTVFGEKDVALNIDNILDNDTFIGLDTVNISNVYDTDTNGTVVLNNNTISYTPPTGFIGADSFEYEVCSADNMLCKVATVTVKMGETISFNIPSSVSGYYTNLFFQDSDFTYESLQILTEDSHTTKLSYIQRHDYLYDADEDMSNTDNVILMYSSESRYWEEYQGNPNYSPQTFNTEHVYPQSFLDDNEVAIADMHLLRVCDATINTSRSNSPFVEGSGTYEKIGDGWYPGDEWKGDVARIVFYVNMYYGEPISDVGTLSTLLEWNIEDPVSAFEEQRNDVIFSAQGNRNPFIDNPYLATLIWGGNDAENKWE